MLIIVVVDKEIIIGNGGLRRRGTRGCLRPPPPQKKNSRLDSSMPQGCQIFRGTTYQNGKYIQIYDKKSKKTQIGILGLETLIFCS
jgi:hypothetical protein